eukprot:scaffold19127_cov150-Skeletonema_marinoi.AAC.3
MATIGTKGSNDASLQLRFYCQNGLSFNTTRPGPFRGHQRVFECVAVALEARRIDFRSKATKWLLETSEVIEIRN